MKGEHTSLVILDNRHIPVSTCLTSDAGIGSVFTNASNNTPKKLVILC
jgi:hypothetical protein